MLNNPLSYTDASGFFFSKIFKAIGRAIASVARAFVDTVAAVAARTASVFSGGKFANGAITGAFAQMYNAEGGAKDFGSDLKKLGSSLPPRLICIFATANGSWQSCRPCARSRSCGFTSVLTVCRPTPLKAPRCIGRSAGPNLRILCQLARSELKQFHIVKANSVLKPLGALRSGATILWCGLQNCGRDIPDVYCQYLHARATTGRRRSRPIWHLEQMGAAYVFRK